jgi:hypothetical protein
VRAASSSGRFGLGAKKGWSDFAVDSSAHFIESGIGLETNYVM